MLLAAALATEPASAEPPPPKITFTGLDAKGCKLFEITDKDKDLRGNERDGQISKVTIQDSFQHLKKVTSSGSHTLVTEKFEGEVFAFHFTYASETKVTITVCPKKEKMEGGIDFAVIAFDGQTPPQESRLQVIERVVTDPLGEGFVADLFVGKAFNEANCEKAKATVKTDNVSDVKLKCEKTEAGFVNIRAEGKLTDPKKPGLASVVYDPPAVEYLAVFEICVPRKADEPEKVVCPGGVKLELED